MDTPATPARAGTHEEYRPDATSRATDGGDDAGEPPRDPPRNPAVSGPHAGHDRYGRFDYRYWRCEACGLETTQDISDGCPRCAQVARGGADGGAGGSPTSEDTETDDLPGGDPEVDDA